MAGKCNFLTGRLFGKVGRAALKALYARANSNMNNLDKPTRSSLLALRDIIVHCKPMTIPGNPVADTYGVIYTDAYFKLGEKIYRPGDDDLPNWDSNATKDIENGWAAVCFHQGDVHKLPTFRGDFLRSYFYSFLPTKPSFTSSKLGPLFWRLSSSSLGWNDFIYSVVTTRHHVMCSSKASVNTNQ